MRPNSEIPSLFERIYQENLDLHLINVYKGFPISYAAQITAIDRKSIQVKSSPFQIVCIYQDKETYIRSSAFPYAVHAKMMKVDISQAQVILSRFEYISGNIGERKQVRVEPEVALEGMIKPEDKHMNLIGELSDISLDGLAILLSPGLQATKILREGTRVVIHIELPIENKPLPLANIDIIPRRSIHAERFSGIKKPISSTDMVDDAYLEYPAIFGQSYSGVMQKEFKIEGIVKNIVADKDLRKHRIGISLINIGSNRTVISQFILQRQTHILNEIRELYTMLSQAYSNLNTSI